MTYVGYLLVCMGLECVVMTKEFEDNTVGTQTFACVGSCEIVDLT